MSNFNSQRKNKRTALMLLVISFWPISVPLLVTFCTVPLIFLSSVEQFKEREAYEILTADVETLKQYSCLPASNVSSFKISKSFDGEDQYFEANGVYLSERGEARFRVVLFNKLKMFGLEFHQSQEGILSGKC